METDETWSKIAKESEFDCFWSECSPGAPPSLLLSPNPPASLILELLKSISDGWRQEAKNWVPAPSNAIIVAAALNQREFHRMIKQSHRAVSTWCPCWCHAFAKFSWETLLWIPQSRANLKFRSRNRHVDISEVVALHLNSEMYLMYLNIYIRSSSWITSCKQKLNHVQFPFVLLQFYTSMF